MAETILFVFEGAKTEKNVLKSLKQYFLKDTDDVHICVTYNTHIYTLYNEVKDDSFLDIVEVLRTRKGNQEDLKDIRRESVSQVYLFFDHDGHDARATNEKIVDLLEFFNEETEMGKLYVSYPMIEAIKHLNSKVPFETVCADIKNNTKYKGLAHSCCNVVRPDYASLTQEHWKYIISEHCKKLNHLVLEEFELPKKYFPQDEIFNHQLHKHIIPKEQVAVLCAFPVFIVDYYGAAKLEDIVS